jgi:hypothetical protein
MGAGLAGLAGTPGMVLFPAAAAVFLSCSHAPGRCGDDDAHTRRDHRRAHRSRIALELRAIADDSSLRGSDRPIVEDGATSSADIIEQRAKTDERA